MSKRASTQDTVTLKKIAALDLVRAPQGKIAAAVGLNRFQVRRLMGSQAYKDLIDRMTDEALLPVLASIKDGLGKLVPECVRVLKEKLESNSLDAVKITFDGLGAFEHKDKGPANDTSISIVLPSGVEAKTLTAQYETILPGSDNDASSDSE